MLGLLLKTFGLTGALRLLHPPAWVTGLLAEEAARANDARHRDRWWKEARRTGELLRARFGAGQLPSGAIWWRRRHCTIELSLVSWEWLKHESALYAVPRDFAISIDVRELAKGSPQQRELLYTSRIRADFSRILSLLGDVFWSALEQTHLSSKLPPTV